MTVLLDGREWAPTLTGERTEVYGVDVLDADEHLIFTLPQQHPDTAGAGMVGGKVSFNLDRTVMCGASLNLVNVQGLIDWMSYRLRPWVSVNGIRWNLGVFIPSSPDAQYSADAVVQTVTLLGKTSILKGDQLDAHLSIAAGDPVVPWVEQVILDSTGESVTGIIPSDETLHDALTWKIGTTRLKVVNDLLGAMSYNPLWTDRNGLWRSEPWEAPGSKVPKVVFAEGDSSIHSAKFTVSQNTTGVPNKVICETFGDDSNKAMRSVATNTDPSSNYSYGNRGGRWITKSYQVDATSQAALDRIALKNLHLNSTPPWYVSVAHAVVPLDGRDIVQFTSAGIDQQVVVNEWGVQLSPGSLMTGKWKAATI